MTIREIKEKMYQQNHIDTKIKELEKRKAVLQDEEQKLWRVWKREERDVERLEAPTLSAIWYTLTGRKAEMLDREKQEACAAAVKYGTVKAESEEISRELERLYLQKRSKKELEQMLDCAVAERKEWIKANCPEKAEQVWMFEKDIAKRNEERKEIREAICAGRQAERIMEEVKKSLDAAEGWGTWDMMGGGMFSTMAKHSHLDTAQQKINELQSCLTRFRTELADVSLTADIQIQIDGFLRFADYFWDGLFADWAVQKKIRTSQEQLLQAQHQISALLMKLQTMEQEAERKLEGRKRQLENWLQ